MYTRVPRHPARIFVLAAFVGAALAIGLPAAAQTMPGACTVVHNDYGPYSVSGATIIGDRIVSIQSGAIIQPRVMNRASAAA